MSRECIQGCWRIQNKLREGQELDFWAGPMAVHPNLFSRSTPAEAILIICEASYDCPGPGVVEVEVVKGIFKKRTEVKTVETCGIPDSYFED